MQGYQGYQKIISQLEPEIHACGAMVRAAFGAVEYRGKSKRTHDAVTDFDLEVEKRLTEKLNEIDPLASVVGEETGGNRSASRHWLIDPIDGTLHFTHGIPFSTIMLACIEDTVPIAGIIHVVMGDSFYSAIKGQGAYKNGKRIHTSKRPPAEAMVLTEVNLNVNHNENLLRKLYAETAIANLASAGYEFTLVADGRAEARVCKDPYGKDYDFAPGAIIVQEAEGVVKHFDDNDYTTKSNSFIAVASEEVHSRIAEIIANS